MRHPPEPFGQPQPTSAQDVFGGAEFEDAAVLVVRGKSDRDFVGGLPGFLPLRRDDDLLVSRLDRFRHHEESLLPPGFQAIWDSSQRVPG
jgi:hypothetical protein